MITLNSYFVLYKHFLPEHDITIAFTYRLILWQLCHNFLYPNYTRCINDGYKKGSVQQLILKHCLSVMWIRLMIKSNDLIIFRYDQGFGNQLILTSLQE